MYREEIILYDGGYIYIIIFLLPGAHAGFNDCVAVYRRSDKNINTQTVRARRRRRGTTVHIYIYRLYCTRVPRTRKSRGHRSGPDGRGGDPVSREDARSRARWTDGRTAADRLPGARARAHTRYVCERVDRHRGRASSSLRVVVVVVVVVDDGGGGGGGPEEQSRPTT